MTRNEQLALVLELAILSEHRTNAEQQALLDLAWRCDRDANIAEMRHLHNRFGFDPDWRPQNLTARVMASRELDESDGDKEVPEPPNWAKTWARWANEDPRVRAFIEESSPKAPTPARGA